MKIIKGESGYIQKKKVWAIVKTIFEFAIVVALLIIGITQTGSRLNLLTIVAVLGCLPASKSLVEVIMLLPHVSLVQEKVDEIQTCTQQQTVIYDLLLTNTQKCMHVDALVISDNTICGYASHKKTNADEAGKYIKSILENNKYDKVTVKIFDDYKAFIARVESMQNKTNAERKETHMCNILLQISL